MHAFDASGKENVQVSRMSACCVNSVNSEVWVFFILQANSRENKTSAAKPIGQLGSVYVTVQLSNKAL